jgi:peptide/nickel transport system permease protein
MADPAMTMQLDRTPVWDRLRPLPRRFYRAGGLLGMLGAVLVVFSIFVALAAPLLERYDPYAFVGGRLEAPNADFWFGTDTFGRDIYSRVVLGARVSLLVPLVVLSSSVLVGVVLGILAATFSGVVDELVMRATDFFFAFPYLVVALALGAALGPSLRSTIIALALVWWPTYARLVRAQVLRMKSLLYVEAARSIGASNWEIARRHYLSQLVSTLLIKVTMDISLVIGLAAGLSFVGLGAQPPSPEWGLMIADSRADALTAPWTAIFPGAAMFITILGFALLGDALVDAQDPTR